VSCEPVGVRASCRTFKRASGDFVKTIRTYATKVEADLDRIALDAVGISSVVVGVGVDFEGGASGVQLMVPEESAQLALKVLDQERG